MEQGEGKALTDGKGMESQLETGVKVKIHLFYSSPVLLKILPHFPSIHFLLPLTPVGVYLHYKFRLLILVLSFLFFFRKLNFPLNYPLSEGAPSHLPSNSLYCWAAWNTQTPPTYYIMSLL